MIDRSQIRHASLAVQARAKRCWIRKRADNQYRVRPKIHGKSPKIVVFLPGNKVMCVDQRTGEECEANSFKNVCYHVVKANDHREKMKRRRTSKRAA